MKRLDDEHPNEEKHRLVTRCIRALIDATGVSWDTAKDATMQALGELAARGRREYIDCDLTTSYTLFLVDAQGNKRAFTLAELTQLIDKAQTATS